MGAINATSPCLFYGWQQMPASVCGLTFKTLYSIYYKQLTHTHSFNYPVLYLYLIQNRDSHLQKSTEANLLHNRLMRHNNNNSSPVLPGVTQSVCLLAVNTRWAPVALLHRVSAFYWTDWINGNGHWGQTCQGVGFVTVPQWVLNPCLCADCGSLILYPSVCRAYSFKEQI